MLSEKANTICILEILREYSDCDHILTMGDLLKKLAVVYEIHLERRAVYRSISILLEIGYDISTYEENRRGYFLRTREFEQAEVRLLMDSVYGNDVIPPKQAVMLIDKLQHLLSIHKRKSYRNLSILREDNRRNNNPLLFLNLELLDEAISARKKVSFQQLVYRDSTELVLVNSDVDIVSPYALYVDDGSYFLVCTKFKGIHIRRLNRMQNITILDEPAAPPPDGFDPRRYVGRQARLRSGVDVCIAMKCKKHIINELIEAFGDLLQITPAEDQAFFIAELTVSHHAIIQWALQNLNDCEILEPDWMRSAVIHKIATNIYGTTTKTEPSL